MLSDLSPVNFIDEHSRRWAFAAAFGLMAYDVLILFNGAYFWKPDEFDDPDWMEKFGWVKGW